MINPDKHPILREVQRADDYKPGDRIESKFTHRRGLVQAWPEGQPRPANESSLYGAIWVAWDDGTIGHAWRHQVHRV